MRTGSKKAMLEIPVITGDVLGVSVYRGYARLCDLASVSKADIYDQKLNPRGTQRDLSKKHARQAYEYVRNRDFAFWPEVFLCARSRSVATYKPSRSGKEYGVLRIDLKKACNDRSVAISRVDGNHRLHYADGSSPGYPAIQKTVSFCLAHDLSREEEMTLFKDINDNQKKMNTSHLDTIEIRLNPEEELKRRSPDLYVAQKLGREKRSPFFGRVYEGGKKKAGLDIPLRTLRTGINYMLTRSTQLILLPDADVQLAVVSNYFSAVKKWQPKAWSSPKEYLVLRGAGLWAMCFIGANVIDKSLLKGKFETDYMLRLLRSGRIWDWSTSGDFRGYSGRSGALEISKKVITQLTERSKKQSKELYRQIMESVLTK